MRKRSYSPSTLDLVRKVKNESHSGVSNSLRHHGLQIYRVHGILQARILEWVVFPLSRGSSQPRGQTQVTCIAGGVFYHLSHRGSPRILEWVIYPISSGSSPSRNRTGPPCQCRRHKRCGLGRSPVGGHGNPFQYSCLDNPRDRRAWWATFHRVAKTWHTHLCK